MNRLYSLLTLLVAAGSSPASGFTFFHPGGRQDAEHCSEGDGIRALNWDTTCTRFFQCVGGLWTVRSCSTGLVIDLATERCTHPDNTVEWIRPECRDTARLKKLAEEEALLKQEQELFAVGVSGGNTPDASNTAPYVGRNPYLCTGHSPHVPIPHRECHKYRQCVSGFWVTRECNPGTVFDVSRLRCAHRHLSWGCGLKAENAYKQKIEEWTALAKQEEEERERLEGPTEPTVFSSFGGFGQYEEPSEDLTPPAVTALPEIDSVFTITYFTEKPTTPEPAAQAEQAAVSQTAVVKKDPSAPRQGSPCAGDGGTQLFPVEGDCGVYLECAPEDALNHSLLLRRCPVNTYFEPHHNQCDYQAALLRQDCGDGQEKSSEQFLPSGDILEQLINLAQN